MLIIFKSPAHGDITYFGEIAEALIRLMGHSGTVPGAIDAEEVPAALARLKAGLAASVPRSGAASREQEDESEEETPVPLSNRALPLVELLEAAAAARAYVMWESK
ncbi:DUF1840 domain-containing protein [Thioalkalivibrio sulfidiphilus]|uniref:DUF1840 domain-containing protein n=1 Tax=Thioalkalivibrio sulfidiphilus (strain HL-EbGR7) TaxID=396588 RepID=B8GST0_THISH|nr:DUF1840 domain-containing protein [Thioalkalivibrio sulfidiphilus]ACL71115.1 Domain of unknown function DUF1840 [Thioalkalivibrio sulfidiphilus HL-EbGr7]